MSGLLWLNQYLIRNNFVYDKHKALKIVGVEKNYYFLIKKFLKWGWMKFIEKFIEVR